MCEARSEARRTVVRVRRLARVERECLAAALARARQLELDLLAAVDRLVHRLRQPVDVHAAAVIGRPAKASRVVAAVMRLERVAVLVNRTRTVLHRRGDDVDRHLEGVGAGSPAVSKASRI